MQNRWDKHGGPAFPVRVEESSTDCEHSWEVQYKGMTLRDWFAGQALAATGDDADSPDRIAADAYALADAMLKMRNETE